LNVTIKIAKLSRAGSPKFARYATHRLRACSFSSVTTWPEITHFRITDVVALRDQRTGGVISAGVATEIQRSRLIKGKSARVSPGYWREVFPAGFFEYQ
jgi:hypothetical protein